MAKNFSQFERKIAQFLRGSPLVKKIIKKIYQYLNFIIHYKNRKRTSYTEIKRYLVDGDESFFGYYDKSPINKSGKYLLFHSTSLDTSKNPTNTEPIDIVVYDHEKQEALYIHQTSTWNWQQGARLQWLTNEAYAFNDFDENLNRFITRVYKIHEDSELKQFKFPIQDAYKNQYFLSLNYTRLNTLRPDYGYRNLPNLDEDKLNTLNNDGIWYVNFKTGDSELLLSLDKIVNFKYKDRFKDSKHYVNHIMISPNGEKFIFLHRFYLKGVRYDRLILSDLQGSMTLLNDHDMISHYYWWGNSNVFGYMRGVDGKDGYYIIDCEDASMQLYEDHDLQKYGDGHPHIYENKFVTDIYPDKSRTQTLIYGDLNKKKHLVLAHLHNSLKYDGESRCDLHPRLSYDGTKVFFDSVHYGKRKLCMMDIKDIND